jgi:hypothetical protein
MGILLDYTQAGIKPVAGAEFSTILAMASPWTNNNLDQKRSTYHPSHHGCMRSLHLPTTTFQFLPVHLQCLDAIYSTNR